MKSTFIDKLSIVLILTTMACYIFRGVIVTYGISYIPYIFTIILMFIFFFKKKYLTLDNSVYIFVFIGLIMTIMSFFIISNNSITASLSGFLVNYINYILWILIITRLHPNYSPYFYKHVCSFVFICAIVSAFLAFYQIFFDTTVFGLAKSGIYADEDAMSSGQFQSRATALLTSAQNYGFFMGMAFCVSFNEHSNNKLLWLLGMSVILVGVFVSNSRSASSCIIVTFVFGLFYKFKSIKKNKSTIFVYVLVFLLIAYALFELLNSEYAEFFGRLSNFGTDNSQSVYKSTLAQFDFPTYFSGLGMGYRNWTVNSLLGVEQYRAAYGEYYYSVESYFLTLLVQGGGGLFLSFIYIVIKALIKSYKRDSLPILICMIINMTFTPSMSGLAISFIFWPFLLRELVNQQKQVFK